MGDRGRAATDRRERNSEQAAAPELPATRLFARLETLAILLALFLFATSGSFLVPGMAEHAAGTATTLTAYQPTGTLHLLELGVAFAISLVLVFRRWRSVANVAGRMAMVTALAGLAIASCLWSIQPLLSLRSGVYLLINTLLVYYLVQRFTLEGLMRLVMGLGVVVAVASVLTAVLLPDYGLSMAGSHRVLQGAFVAKNELGYVSVLLLTPALFARNVRKLPRTLYIVTMLALVMLSFSEQAWAAALFCLCFAFARLLFLRLRTRDAVWLSFVTLLPLAVGTLLLVTYWVDVLGFLGKDPTLSGRTIIWHAVLLSAVKKPLLGWGYNAFWQGFKGESGEVLLLVHFAIAQSQNGPLEVLLGVGAAGLALLAATVLQAFRNVSRCFRLGAMEAGAWYLLIIVLTLYYAVGEANLEQANTLTWMMYMMACTGLRAEVLRARATAMDADAVLPESYDGEDLAQSMVVRFPSNAGGVRA